jgi:nickel/cobalt exporter
MESTTLTWMYFPSALLLGALHALEPGHAKALTAAYLIGIKGRKRDSFVLGLSAAATHSIVVVAISVLGIWLGNEAFAGGAAKWLERASGIVAISVGCWLLWRRLFRGKAKAPAGALLRPPPQSAVPPALTAGISFQPVKPHEHGHDHGHDHMHMDDEAHARAHAADLPDYVHTGERPSFWQIVAFGAAGGMVPCPASITVMLLALSTGRGALGLFTVLGFSIGLAITLVGIGLAVVTGMSKISANGRLHWLSAKAPAISAGLVIASGVFALLISH